MTSEIFTLEVLHATRGHTYKGVERCLLLELAEHRNADTGLCCPGVERLAEFCGITRANVSRALKNLEARTTGVGIRVERSGGGRGRVNHYFFMFHGAAEISTNPRELAGVQDSETRANSRVNPRELARKPARTRAANPLGTPLEPGAGSPSTHPAIAAEIARAAVEDLEEVADKELTRAGWRSLVDRDKPGGLSASLADGDPGDLFDTPFAVGQS